VTDIKGYSTHTDRQDRGDGRLYVFSPRLDETIAIPQLLTRLRHALYETNRVPGAITACRLVDSTQLKDKIDRANNVNDVGDDGGIDP
jgi:hypothetical protein